MADVGRSTMRGVPPDHDDSDVAGDPRYAPPEMLYGEPPSSWDARRMGCDAYHLGSMIVWMFLEVGMTPLLLCELEEDMQPEFWGGSYGEVLPFVRDAFDVALEYFCEEVPIEFKDDVTEVVRQLCDPDPALRGHPKNHAALGSSYSLQRYVSKLNLLARRAEVKLAR